MDAVEFCKRLKEHGVETRPFFLGMIVGQFAVAATWLIIDYFTGMTDNVVFWI